MMGGAALWIVPWEDGPRGRTRACQKIGQTAIWGGSSTGMLPIVGGERRAAESCLRKNVCGAAGRYNRRCAAPDDYGTARPAYSGKKLRKGWVKCRCKNR